MSAMPETEGPQLLVLGYVSRGAGRTYTRAVCRAGFCLLALLLIAETVYAGLCSLAIADNRYYAPLLSHWDFTLEGWQLRVEAIVDFVNTNYSLWRGPLRFPWTPNFLYLQNWTDPRDGALFSPYPYLTILFFFFAVIALVGAWRGGKPVRGHIKLYTMMIMGMIIHFACLSAVMGSEGLLCALQVMGYRDRTSTVMLIPAAISVLCVLLALDLRACVRWIAANPQEELPFRPFLPTVEAVC